MGLVWFGVKVWFGLESFLDGFLHWFFGWFFVFSPFWMDVFLVKGGLCCFFFIVFFSLLERVLEGLKRALEVLTGDPNIFD